MSLEEMQAMLTHMNQLAIEALKRLQEHESRRHAQMEWKRIKKATDPEWLDAEREKSRLREAKKRAMAHERENEKRVAAGQQALPRRGPGRPRKIYDLAPGGAAAAAQ